MTSASAPRWPMPLPNPEEFEDIELRPIPRPSKKSAKNQAGRDGLMRFYKPSKRTPRWCYLVPITVLVLIIVALVTTIAMMAPYTHWRTTPGNATPQPTAALSVTVTETTTTTKSVTTTLSQPCRSSHV